MKALKTRAVFVGRRVLRRSAKHIPAGVLSEQFVLFLHETIFRPWIDVVCVSRIPDLVSKTHLAAAAVDGRGKGGRAVLNRVYADGENTYAWALAPLSLSLHIRYLQHRCMGSQRDNTEMTTFINPLCRRCSSPTTHATRLLLLYGSTSRKP